MRAKEFIREGGWETTATQGTEITPNLTKVALDIMGKKFVPDFNKYLQMQGIPGIKMGHPTGSSAHYQKDPQETIYGDIDLQVIVPPIEGKNTTGEKQAFWGSQVRNFIKMRNPAYLHPDNAGMLARKEGNGPIVQVGKNQFIQIDVMPHTQELAKWGQFRATAERGIKGLLNGNIFSVLGTMFDFNLQHSGVQYKTQHGKKVNYTDTRKDYELNTITTDINKFVHDIFQHEAREIRPHRIAMDPLLQQYQGVQNVNNVEDLRIQHLVNAVKGLARSFELSGMYGKGDLTPYRNAQEFLGKFIELYMEKANYAITNKKFDKAATPEAVARAQRDKQNIAQGAQYVQSLFTSDKEHPRYLDWKTATKA